MKKYSIFTVARTGSTLYTNLVAFYYNCVTGNLNTVFWQTGERADWTYPIQHVHSVTVWEQTPEDFIPVLTTRSTLDSVLSKIIAIKTEFWHIENNATSTEYQEKFNNAKFTIDMAWFKETVNSTEYLYQEAYNFFNNWSGEKYLLEYNKHLDPMVFYNTLGITFDTSEIYNQRVLKNGMSIDKFSMVENLSEVINTYKGLNIRYNFDDDRTIAHAESFL